MSDEEFDQWELASGLGLDDVDCDVTAAEFTINTKLGHENLCLALTLTPRDGDEEKVQYFSMGPGWVASDSGRAATSESGEPKKISQTSNLGLLLASITKAIGKDGARALGNPLKASTYAGTAWHVARDKRLVRNPSTGEDKETSYVVFTAQLEGKKKASSGGSAAAPKAEKASSATVERAVEKFRAIAAEAKDEDDFFEKAAGIDEISDREVQKVLYGKDFYESLKAA